MLTFALAFERVINMVTIVQLVSFERVINMVTIVQLVRASDCGSECRGFESH